MKSVPPAYRINIRHRKSYPDFCPVCGYASTEFTKPVLTTMDCLNQMYSLHADVYKVDVPGWRGFHTWVYLCHHESRLDGIFGASPVLSILSKGKAEFSGHNYMIPIPLDRTR